MISESSGKDKTPFREVLSALSSEGAVEILGKTGSKLISSRETPNKLGLTKRQYYSRIRELKELGVIKKEGEGYIRTERGEDIYGFVSGMFAITGDEPDNIDICPEGDPVLDPWKAKTGQVKTTTDYEDLVEEVLEILENASDEILFASRYIDSRVVKKFLRFEEEDKPTLNVVVREFDPLEIIELIKAISSPGEIKDSVKFARNHIRVVSDLPYSFFVADRKEVGIEIVNPYKPTTFYMGLTMKNEKIGKELRDFFSYLFKEAGKFPTEEQEGDFTFRSNIFK